MEQINGSLKHYTTQELLEALQALEAFISAVSDAAYATNRRQRLSEANNKYQIIEDEIEERKLMSYDMIDEMNSQVN